MPGPIHKKLTAEDYRAWKAQKDEQKRQVCAENIHTPLRRHTVVVWGEDELC